MNFAKKKKKKKKYFSPNFFSSKILKHGSIRN